MKAVRLFEHGGPEVLRYVEVPTPRPGPGEVLIRVRATAINQWDLRYRAGKLPPNPLPGRPAWPLPFQLGRDAAGEITEVGPGVESWQPGDRVVQMPHPACGSCALCVRGRDNLCLQAVYPGHQSFGGYAECIVRSQHAVLPIPDGVDFETAAATLWSYTTPLNCATRRAPVGVGDSVVITGASGGLAIACAQLAALAGATTIATTTKAGWIDELKSLGYDHVLLSTDPGLPAQVKELTGGLGADVVWDCVGGNAFLALAVACVRVGGAIAVLGAPVSEDSFVLEMNSLSFIFGELDVVGVRAAGRRDQQLCLRLLAERKISPVIDRRFPLAEAAAAHRYLEQHRQIGKILLVPEGTA